MHVDIFANHGMYKMHSRRAPTKSICRALGLPLGLPEISL